MHKCCVHSKYYVRKGGGGLSQSVQTLCTYTMYTAPFLKDISVIFSFKIEAFIFPVFAFVFDAAFEQTIRYIWIVLCIKI